MKVKGRLLELDCLRGVAAMLVVIFHFTLGQPWLHNIFKYGCAGVELFFMISGFVIFLTIEKTNSYKDFLRSRFARLFPAYWTCITITTLAMISWAMFAKIPLTFPSLKEYLINLTMLQYYFNVKNIDAPYWTLIYELIFYLFILIIYLVRLLPKIEFISLLILLVCFAYGTIVRSEAPQMHERLNALLPIINFFPLFIAGIIFYKIKFYKISLYRISLLALSLITQIILFYDTGKIEFMTQMQYCLILIAFFAVFILYCFDVLGFIINRFTLFTGKISYSLYLIHDYISFSLLIPLFEHSRHFHFNYWIVDFVIVLPIILILAALINKWIEVPAMNYLKRKRLNGNK